MILAVPLLDMGGIMLLRLHQKKARSMRISSTCTMFRSRQVIR